MVKKISIFNEYINIFTEVSNRLNNSSLIWGVKCKKLIKHVKNIGGESVSNSLAVKQDLESLFYEKPSSSVGVMLINDIINNLNPYQMDKILTKIYEKLCYGGVLILTAPYTYEKSEIERLLPLYKSKVLKEKGGKLASNKSTKTKYLHAFDIPLLYAVLEQYGFKIHNVSMFDLNDEFPGSLGGVGFIMEKQLQNLPIEHIVSNLD